MKFILVVLTVFLTHSSFGLSEAKHMDTCRQT